MRRFLFLSAIVIIPFLVSFTPQNSKNVVSAKLKVQKALNGKKVTIEAEVLYLIDKKEIRMHYTSPDEFIFISNILGESKLYFPKKNEVALKQNDILSAETDILFLFFTQNMSELGLKNIGFQLVSSNTDGNYLITRWTSPIGSEGISEIELVFENYVPIYTSFISSQGKPLNKTYYNNYQEMNGYYIPLRITEVAYLNSNDSIVSRKEYSDIKFDSQVSSSLIDFKIPNNAKVVK